MKCGNVLEQRTFREENSGKKFIDTKLPLKTVATVYMVFISVDGINFKDTIHTHDFFVCTTRKTTLN